MGYSAFDGHSAPAWNAGRKVGPKRALKQKEVWAIRFWLEQERVSATARSSILQSTANCADVISSGRELETWSAV